MVAVAQADCLLYMRAVLVAFDAICFYVLHLLLLLLFLQAKNAQQICEPQYRGIMLAMLTAFVLWDVLP